jgi:hypothetical protein
MTSSKLAASCGVTGFSLMDITKPEPVRFRSVLSGVINFAKFRSVMSCLIPNTPSDL